MNKRLFWLLFFIFIFIAIRSINYIYYLNWSGDQAASGIEALRLFRTKALTLIGPQISANFEGRFIFQGPIISYMFLMFLLAGKWDPVTSSYLFMLFASFMIVPLFFGVKKLVNEKAAWLMVIIYALVPYYINYTRFLWNSTFLLSFIPILFLLMGFSNIFFVSIWLGILLQFHYQFVLVIVGLAIYYFAVKRLKPINLLYFIGGIAIGFSPLIIFELRHNFYHLKTFIVFIQNWDKIDRPGGLTTPHYYISISIMLIAALMGIFKKRIKNIPYKIFALFALFLGLYSFYIFSPVPEHAFWSYTSPWNYLNEKKIYDIIRSTNFKKDFNIANLAYYDTKAYVVKYFMKRDGYEINYDDYYGNKYLFVVSEKTKYLTNPSYEVATFKPHKLIKKWEINNRYNMVLLERE